MANKTNCNKNGHDYYRAKKKVGMRINKAGNWVVDYKDFYGVNKKETETKYDEYMKRKASGIDETKACFGAMMEFYIYQVFNSDSSYAQGTKERYESAYRKYIKPSDLCGIDLANVKSFDIQKLYNNLNCSDAALRAVHNIIGHFFSYVEREHIGRDITRNLVLPVKGCKSPTQEISIWSDEEIVRILSSIGEHRLRLLVILALNSGCRISELLAIQYTDLDDQLHITKQLLSLAEFNGKEKADRVTQLIEPKTKSSIRDIPLSQAVLEEVRKHSVWHKEEMMKNGYRTDFIFTTKTGKPYNRHNITNALNRFYKKASVVPKSFHTYRHTFCTNLCKHGVKLEIASKLLGHDNIGVTAKYYRQVDETEKREAIEKISAIFI